MQGWWRGLAWLGLLGLLGCSLPPAGLPTTPAAIFTGHSAGALVSATTTFARRDPVEDDGSPVPSRCAHANEGDGLHPATADRCIPDGQGYALLRHGVLSLGALAYGGTTTVVAVGGLASVRLLDDREHRLVVGAGLWFAWAAAELGYAARVADGAWLYVAPGLGASAGQRAGRASVGGMLDIGSGIAAQLELGWAYRFDSGGYSADYSHHALHVGLGLAFGRQDGP